MSVLFNEGKYDLLEWMWVANPLQVLKWGLFTAPGAIDFTKEFSDFTMATFTGYAAVNLDRSEFGVGGIVAGEALEINSAAPTFTHTAGASQTILGWLLYNATSGRAIAGDLFPVARVMSPGVSETLDPLSFYLKGY